MMTWSNFYQTVSNKLENYQSAQAIWIRPSLNRLPLPIQRFDEPFFPLSRSIIQATRDYVSVYIFDLAHFLATGAAGMVALERSIAYAKEDALTILHGPFVGSDYAVLADDISLALDGLTVTTRTDLQYYVTHLPFGAFLINGENIKNGGIFTSKHLVLYHDSKPDIIYNVITTDDLLQDLTESYIESIQKRYVYK